MKFVYFSFYKQDRTKKKSSKSFQQKTSYHWGKLKKKNRHFKSCCWGVLFFKRKTQQIWSSPGTLVSRMVFFLPSRRSQESLGLGLESCCSLRISGPDTDLAVEPEHLFSFGIRPLPSLRNTGICQTRLLPQRAGFAEANS